MPKSDVLPVTSSFVNVISALQKIWTMVRGFKDRALKAGELRRTVLALQEKNQQLEQALAQRAAVEGPIGPFGYFYVVSDREHPLCPVCYKMKGVDMPLSPLEDWNGGKLRTCDACGFTREEEPMKPQAIRIGRGKRYSSRVG